MHNEIVARDYDSAQNEFDEAFTSNRLPERPDYAWANEFLLKARRGMVD